MKPTRISLACLAGCLLATGCASSSRDTSEPMVEAPASQPTGNAAEANLPADAQAEPESAYVRGTVDDDRATMREALQGMESADRADINARINLVREIGISGREGVPQPGELAPDFKLAPLRFYDFQVDATPITKENADTLYEPVRLSVFRGNLPVVLIFGSYT